MLRRHVMEQTWIAIVIVESKHAGGIGGARAQRVPRAVQTRARFRCARGDVGDGNIPQRRRTLGKGDAAARRRRAQLETIRLIHSVQTREVVGRKTQSRQQRRGNVNEADRCGVAVSNGDSRAAENQWHPERRVVRVVTVLEEETALAEVLAMIRGEDDQLRLGDGSDLLADVIADLAE